MKFILEMEDIMEEVDMDCFYEVKHMIQKEDVVVAEYRNTKQGIVEYWSMKNNKNFTLDEAIEGICKDINKFEILMSGEDVVISIIESRDIIYIWQVSDIVEISRLIDRGLMIRSVGVGFLPKLVVC